MALVLGTHKSHLRYFTHYFHSFLLHLLRLRQLCILVQKTAFLREFELMKLTVQVTYSATRWQMKIQQQKLIPDLRN